MMRMLIAAALILLTTRHPLFTTAVVSVLSLGIDILTDPHKPWDRYRILTFAFSSAVVYGLLKLGNYVTRRVR